MELAKALKEKRKENKYKQIEIANLLGITPSGYASWEQGRTEPSIMIISKIADIYKISIEELIGKTNEYGYVEIDNQLTKEEEHILKMIQKLDTKQKGKAEGYISAMIEENKYKTIKEG